MRERLLIEDRFCGPPGAGNGGYVAGRLAAFFPEAAEGRSPSWRGLSCARELCCERRGCGVEVSLRRAVPLGRELDVEREGALVRLRDGDVELAVAAPADVEIAVPEPVRFEEAAEAEKAFPRREYHPVPRCFVCGTGRPAGDGLRIFPGPLGRDGVWAAPWIPDPSLSHDGEHVSSEFVWAALDCTGAFATNEPSRGLALLGRLAARLVKPVRVGERCVVLGWPIAIEGRKLYPGTAVFSEEGELRAVARATWILTAGPGAPS